MFCHTFLVTFCPFTYTDDSRNSIAGVDGRSLRPRQCLGTSGGCDSRNSLCVRRVRAKKKWTSCGCCGRRWRRGTALEVPRFLIMIYSVEDAGFHRQPSQVSPATPTCKCASTNAGAATCLFVFPYSSRSHISFSFAIVSHARSLCFISCYHTDYSIRSSFLLLFF